MRRILFFFLCLPNNKKKVNETYCDERKRAKSESIQKEKKINWMKKIWQTVLIWTGANATKLRWALEYVCVCVYVFNCQQSPIPLIQLK